MELLRTSHLRVTFGGLSAVDDVDLTVESGRLVGLIGPNGAGKTTLIDGVTGFVPTTGKIEFAGTEISREPAHRRARRGLARTWQSLELFEDLDVADNLEVAATRQSAGRFLGDLVWPTRRFAGRETRGLKTARAHVDFALDVLDLRDIAGRMPRELSQGQRKLVSAARALASRPQLLCMDEPAAGLDTFESLQLGRRLRDIIDAGITILLVDHDMALVLSVCDYVYVIEFGQVIAQGTPDEIRRDRRVIQAYLGSSAERTES